jgi:ABC-type Fe3+ transport system substrate-binding protein
MSIHLRAAALAAGAVVCLSAPVAADIDMKALHEAAKKEGALALYGGGPRGPYMARAARFEAAFPGIKVEFVNGPSNVLSERINKARAEGKPHADVAALQTIQDFVNWKAAAQLTPFKPDAWDAIPDSFKDKDGHFTGHSLIMIAYAHRPDLVSLPFKTAKDILNPAYKGKVISTYPHLDDATLYHYTKIAERYGWGFWDEYAKLESKWVRGHLGVAQSLEKGESAASLDQIPSGNKVSTLVIPDDEPATLFQQTLAIFKDAPHPNAAKLYVNWYMGKEEAASVPASGSWSTRVDVAPPRGMKPLKDYKLNAEYVSFITGDAAKVNALRARFKAISGEWSGVDVR